MGTVEILFVAKGLRAFCYGFLGVLFPIYLTDMGASPWMVGAAISLTLLANAAMTYAVRIPARKYGARPVFCFLSAMLAFSAVLFLFSRHPWMAVLAAMAANMSSGEGESGAFLTLEQVTLSRAAVSGNLSAVFSYYQLAGYLSAAIGAACVGNISADPRVFFWTLLSAAVVLTVLYRFLKLPEVDFSAQEQEGSALPPWVKRVAWLFALDSFAGGFVGLSLVVYWLYTRFQMSPETLGMVSFAAQAAAALSFLLAGPVSKKIGLVPTIVFSHLISNIFLIGVAFAPSANIAVALLLARYLLSQIDVPTRHAFLMMSVKDHEREAAASVTNMSRTLAKAASPAIAGSFLAFSMSAPFLIGGVLKIAYDLMLYRTIRDVRD